MSKILFTDVDGVVAIYERHAYKPENSAEKPLWLRKNSHYFATVKPDYRIIDAYENLHEDYGIQICAITNIPDLADMIDEHYSDKFEWAQIYLPFINSDTRLVITVQPKFIEAEKILNRKLTKDDILISDYNKDLTTWTANGGTAIKYLNGQNSAESWDGLNIPSDMGTKDIISFLKQTLKIN